ncbi:MAG TPA: riboflavin synthase [Candidatus Desulfofervidus auxilii]|uniref:Riboflavin synthase n=1 Tax=Desulfofervidus auxilii TaxID=1621989 RepID=A0A7V0I9N5_DESA2|nr:riboflavin synthase [Candidatus Desulfofervidus auxilii]
MFTGLIEGKGEIIRFEKGKMYIKPLFALDELKIGESIAINGVCLTVIKRQGDIFIVELSPETLSRTTFKFYHVGDLVNLERALKVGDRLGGHLVTGHVDTIGIVIGKNEKGEHFELNIEIPKKWMKYVVEKGSIAVDGVSLTINKCFDNGFTVNIIPHTAKITILGQYRVGSRVNIETDLIGKYVARLLSAWEKGEINEEFLKKHGFW